MKLSAKADPVKLFRRLQEGGGPVGDIIDKLEAQQDQLRPEDIINNALRLDSQDAIRLLGLVEGAGKPIDLSNLSIHLNKVEDPEFKLPLLRYLGGISNPKIPLLAAKFLRDDNRLVVMEALNALDRQTAPFDVSVLLPHMESMAELPLRQAMKIVDRLADTDLVPHLSSYLNTRSDELNEFFIRLVVRHADQSSFEKFLRRLMLEEDYERQQAVAAIQQSAGGRLSEVARVLANHELEFVRQTAQQLVINLIGDDDLGKLEEFSLSDDWQLRERAIQSLSKSANRGAVAILKKQAETFPEDYVLVLRAVRRLGFGTGLEVAFEAIKTRQANVQRAALETIEAITTEKHATSVRNSLLKGLPLLTVELREFAKMVMAQITRDFDLPGMQIDDDSNTGDGAVDLPLFGEAGGARRQVENIVLLDSLGPGEVWMDRYHIEQEIGRGAMGRVMLAEDDMVDEPVILKFMLPELTVDKDSVERFKREVKYARKVSHRNVIRVHDILLKDNICAISMEYFESRGLEVVLAEIDCFETLQGLEILYQVAGGMAAAHEEGVIHRDLKPSNILIDDQWQAKIVDFGIASAGAAAEASLTQTGSIMGSPAYLAPERAQGFDADERSDIYSLGIIAYRMFSSRLPYVGKPMEVLAMHKEGKAEPVDRVRKGAPSEVSRLIMRMMAVDRDARPQSMAEVRDEVGELVKRYTQPKEIA